MKAGWTPAQEPLGQALYAHYGVVMDESYLIVANGRTYTASRGDIDMCRILGGPWHLFRAVAIVPERLRNRIYAAVARNRYRWFGKAAYCEPMTEAQRARLIGLGTR